MNIAIITAEWGVNASTLDDSVSCYFQYGNFNYNRLILKNGFLRESLDEYDVIIIHYSCIALPLKQSFPINAITSYYLSKFRGLKLAFIQDEQNSCIERFNYFQSIKIDHLFSVAPVELFDTLYPDSKRNFTITQVLTGYISDKHIKIWQNRIPLIERDLDLVFRGRVLPAWMGSSPALKSESINVLKDMKSMKIFKCSLSNTEKDRIYGDSWFSFLQSGRVSILTQSGSDYLDIDGVTCDLNKNDLINTKLLLKANYNVISPRYFDYVASGNLVAIAPGFYSNIPIEGTYAKISNELCEIPEILEFAKTNSAQLLVDKAQNELLQNKTLHYSFLVSSVEHIIDEKVLSKSTQFYETPKKIKKAQSIVEPADTKLFIHNLKYMSMIFLKNNLFKKLVLSILSLNEINSLKFLLHYDLKTIIFLVRKLPQPHIKYFFSLGLLSNLLELYEFLNKDSVDNIFSRFNFGNTWELDLKEYGITKNINYLSLQEKLKNDKESLYCLLINISLGMK